MPLASTSRASFKKHSSWQSIISTDLSNAFPQVRTALPLRLYIDLICRAHRSIDVYEGWRLPNWPQDP